MNIEVILHLATLALIIEFGPLVIGLLATRKENL